MSKDYTWSDQQDRALGGATQAEGSGVPRSALRSREGGGAGPAAQAQPELRDEGRHDALQRRGVHHEQTAGRKVDPLAELG